MEGVNVFAFLSLVPPLFFSTIFSPQSVMINVEVWEKGGKKKKNKKKNAAWNVCQLCRVGGFISLIIAAK